MSEFTKDQMGRVIDAWMQKLVDIEEERGEPLSVEEVKDLILSPIEDDEAS